MTNNVDQKHVGQKLANLVGCASRTIYQLCSVLKLKLKQHNDYNLSYEQLKEGFKTCNIHKRGAFKRKAQEKFPKIFKSEDFPPKWGWKKKYISYRIIVDTYKSKVLKLSESSQTRCTMSSILRALYHKAKEYFPKEFKEEDFQRIRKPKKFTYLQAISLHAKHVVGKYRHKRYAMKNYAKRNYPDEFKESDFPFKKRRKYSVLTYTQLVLSFKRVSGVQRGIVKKIARKKYGNRFVEKDFPRLNNPYYKYSYEQLKKEFKKEKEAVKRYSIRRKAKSYKKYKECDFPHHRYKYDKYRRLKYQELVSLFEQEHIGFARSIIKNVAQRKFPNRFKIQDFPRKVKYLIEYSYSELVEEYKKLSKEQKVGGQRKNIEESRSRRKRIAQKLFPDQFRREDFPRIHLTV